MRESSEKRQQRLVRTRQRQADFVRKAGPHGNGKERTSRRADLASALNEWAEDYEGTHSIFGD